MKKKMILAFVATMSFLAPNLADACSITTNCAGGQSVGCGADYSCVGNASGVVCTNRNGSTTTAKCPKVIAPAVA